MKRKMRRGKRNNMQLLEKSRDMQIPERISPKINFRKSKLWVV